MKSWHLFIIACTICLAGQWHSLAQAQTQSPPSKSPATVQAFGEHVLELSPERVRLLFIAQAEGATAKEAVERLTKHKAAVRGELIAMKAEADSIKITSSDMRHHTLGVPPQYQNMRTKFFTNLLEGQLNMRLEDLPTVHTATCVVEADWVLPNNDNDLVLQLPNLLREQVDERDLVGNDNGLELSPEQSANIAKFKAAVDEHMGLYDDNNQDQERVQILYVSTIKPEARAQAHKAAFENARQECELLAVASGHKLGRFVSMSKTAPDFTSSLNNFTMSLSPNASETLTTRVSRCTRPNETTSRQADNLQVSFHVEAVFEVE